MGRKMFREIFWERAADLPKVVTKFVFLNISPQIFFPSLDLLDHSQQLKYLKMP